MGYIETLCTKCRKPIWVPEDKLEENRIHACGGELIPMELPHEDYITLCEATTSVKNTDLRVNWNLYNAMVDLKEKDPIEYQLKMSQFKTQVQQQKQQQESNTPKCPTCGSTNIKKISGLSKAGSVAVWGVFAAGRTSKTWHCNNCGSEW
jgi:predicted RNA-binding Zn-ribbon protein involved in translation (DUF1610 family)